MTDLPFAMAKRMAQVLQNIFKCRLSFSAVLNANSSLVFLWNCIKPFLDPVTVDKISISKGSTSKPILSNFSPYQVEQAYGGLAPNLTVFWPPVFPDDPTSSAESYNFTAKEKASKIQIKDYHKNKSKVPEERLIEIDEPIKKPIMALNTEHTNLIDVPAEDENYQNSKVKPNEKRYCDINFKKDCRIL